MIDLEKSAQEYVDDPEITWGLRKPTLKAAYIAGGIAVIESLWKDPRVTPPPVDRLVLVKLNETGTYELCAMSEKGWFEAPKIDHCVIFEMCEIECYMCIPGEEDSEEEEFFPRNKCPEFPYFGASYPDAGCVDGILYDLDHCDEKGNLYVPSEEIPCPFCRPDDFKEWNGMSDEEFDDIMAKLAEQGYKREENV